MNASNAEIGLKESVDLPSPGQPGPASRAVVEGGLRSWEGEARRYFDEILENSRTTLEALARCESPTDVLAVEQAWTRARSEVYLDAGLRFANAFASVAQGLATTAGAERDAGQAATDRASTLV